MATFAFLQLSLGLGGMLFVKAVVRPHQAITESLGYGLRRARQASDPRPIFGFDQIVDHFPEKSQYAPHENGTFKHRYWIEDTFYKIGGPVFLYIIGEDSLENQFDPLDDNFIQKRLMQTFNGIGIQLETRGYGKSWPYNTSSTTDELRYLTTEQIIADHDYFARNVHLPVIDDAERSKTPWIIFGASYPGALTAFTVKTYPDTFIGGIAASALINAQVSFPGYYDPIQLLAPQDCVASVNNIVDNIDSLIRDDNVEAIQKLKDIFGLGAVKDIRDFARAIAQPIGNPLFVTGPGWQEIRWLSMYASRDFYDFCRNVTNINAPANITDIDLVLSGYTDGQSWKNLGNYATYIKRVVLPVCTSGDYNSPGRSCFGTQDPEYWANVRTSTRRSYLYTSCTEMGFYQAAYPWGTKSLISRVIDVNYTQEWCKWSFPDGQYNHLPLSPDVDSWLAYGGLNFTAKNLLFVDGSADAWRESTYHSTRAPQRHWGDVHSEHLLNGAGHAWDFFTISEIEDEPQDIREVHYLHLRTVESWLLDFHRKQHGQE
ncbi:peptidase S28 [Phaeosphaeria sp. MPI-PUGE-AT-0046c]|nr:peptidase S28 [Phaeosphaeria sp. MPI-PUGE-AT-0046c]